jgi:hypothetical protein
LVAAAAIVLPGFQLLRTSEAAPAPRATQAAPADDVLARFKIENLSGLLRVEAVQKDIALTAEQQKKVDELRNKLAADRKNGLFPVGQAAGRAQAVPVPGGGWGPGVPLPQGGAAQIVVAGAFGIDDVEFTKGAAGICTAEQMRRLKQISIQAMGPEALLDRRVIRSLRLSAEQEDKIDALLPAEKKHGVIAIQVNGVDKVAEKADQTWTAALDVLTTEQRKSWDALIGERLPTAELQKAQGGHNVAGFFRNPGPIQMGIGGARIGQGGVLPVVPPNAKPAPNPQQ